MCAYLYMCACVSVCVCVHAVPHMCVHNNNNMCAHVRAQVSCLCVYIELSVLCVSLKKVQTLTILMLLMKLYSVQPSAVGGDGKVPYEILRDGNILTRRKVLEALKEAVSLA